MCSVCNDAQGKAELSQGKECVCVRVCVPHLGCVETCKQMPSVFSPSPTATYLHVLIKEFYSPSNMFKETSSTSSLSGWYMEISSLFHFSVLYYSLQNNLLYYGITGAFL